MKDSKLSVRISGQLKSQLEAYADQGQRSVAWVVIEAVLAYMRNNKID